MEGKKLNFVTILIFLHYGWKFLHYAEDVIKPHLHMLSMHMYTKKKKKKKIVCRCKREEGTKGG